MKLIILVLLLITSLGVTVFVSNAQQNQNVTITKSEVEALQNRISELEKKLQTVENVEKMELAAKLAEAQAKLRNADIDKLKGELRESNNDWLREWNNWFIGIVTFIVLIIGAALVLVLRTLIEKAIEKKLDGFQRSVEQVKKQQERIRIIERDYAAQMLAEPEKISESGEYIYSETVRSLSEQTIIDVIYHKAISIYTRIRAAEILKKRNPERSLPVLLDMVNSFLDIDVFKDEYFDLDYFDDLLPLFKDIRNETTYRGLSKLLARVQKLNDDTDLKKVYLNWIVFSLAYIGDALNIDKAIPKMKEALPILLISDHEDSNSLEEDSNNLENLVNYFHRFDEHEGIKEILENGLTKGMPEVETRCLLLLSERYPDFVEKWKTDKDTDNTESEVTQ